MPAIDVSASRHPEVAFIGVAVKDSEDDARAFAEEIGISYPLAFDDGTIDDAYPVLGLPATFFINGDGTIVKRHFGVVTIDSLDDDIAELFGS
jgi:cytochrome c biogenesis protein CcmG/thiol:disulfide interchange protein DsbE